MDHSISKFNSDSPFEQIRHVDEQNNEFWLARELMPLLGYTKWQNFQESIERAKIAAKNSQINSDEHFEFLPSAVKTTLKGGRPGDDYKLSRYACYLVAMNGDPRKPEIAIAQAYFVVKTREAEIMQHQVVEVQQPIERALPTRDTVDYIEAAEKLEFLSNGILKRLLTDALVDEIELNRNLKYLPVAEKPKKYTIVRVRAKQLGYTEAQIGDGKQLGKFVKAQIEPSFQEMIGKYPVYHYEINDRLDQAINDYFTKG